MKRRMWMFLIMAMLLRWVYWAAARPFPTSSFAANSRPALDQTDHIHHSPQAASDSKQGGDVRMKIGGEEYRRLSRVGSRPPSCEHKCEGCDPCKPIQIPAATATTHHLNLHYANYEPEGWKCKCGSSFFNP